VLSGEITRLRVYVGSVPTSPTDVRTITATSAEAVAWLSGLASGTSSRAASDAIFALVLADAPDPWPLLLKLARDDDRPRNVRGTALMWLSSGVIDHLGIADADGHDSDDDEMRTQAVFVLSQRPKAESVPELIDLARATKYPAVRKAAIFWLGQSGDRRAADVYAELLGIR
jgi:HEAT repeat protein